MPCVVLLTVPNLNSHTNLVYMSPVLAMVIESLPHHAHDF